MHVAEVEFLVKRRWKWGRIVHGVGVNAAIFAVALVLMAATASASVVGTVNLSSGANATVVATGISLIFNSSCLTPPPLGASVFGGCVGAEVDTLGNGPLGTPSGPLESTINGIPPIGSAVFIQNINALTTTFPIAPFMQFLNSTATAVGITVSSLGDPLSTFGPSAQTNCSAASTTLNGVCSIYNGAIVTLQNKGAGGTSVSVSFSGLACDGTATTCANPSPFNGNFTTQITTIPGVVGSGPNGVILPVDVQRFFGCPTGGTGTLPGQCSNLGGAIQSSNSGTFFATIQAVPEPDSMALTMIGSFLIGAAVWGRRKITARRQ
jgi:hypothetical protein